MAWTFEESRPGYGKLWRSATIKPGADDKNADIFANKIIAGESQYRQVQSATGVPWFFVGALHMREGSCDFSRALCNGEKIIGTDRLTTLEPHGRGPYPSWYDSGIDAMKLKNLHRVQDWSVERMLYSAEAYNGWGYAGKINSPYVWAGTIQEQTGKYTSDHHFDPSVDDPQLGVAAVLKRLAEKRPDIAAVLQGSASDVVMETHKPEPEILLPIPAQPHQQAQQNALERLLPILMQVVQLLLSQKNAPVSPTTIKVDVPPAEPSPLTRPSVQIGALGLAVSTALQSFHILGAPAGADSTVAGTIATLAPAILTGLGVTGVWGKIAQVGVSLIASRISAAQQQKK